jgi:hypothetical protein
MIATLLRSAALAALVPAAYGGGPAPKPHVVTVVAREYAFEAPKTIAAGTVTFRLLNRGKELHHIWLLRLEQGKTADDAIAALKAGGPPPSWVVDVGGPNSPEPGGESQTMVTLAAGHYLLLCMIPSGDNVPHVMKGMVAPLTVTGAAAAAEPRADVTMRLADYGFQFSKPLTAGRHVIRIENVAKQSHEAFMVRLAPGKKAADLLAWLDGGQKGPPPALPTGGITGIAAGTHVILPVDLKPGSYALYCFVPDAKDGQPHVAHGMVSQIEVK